MTAWPGTPGWQEPAQGPYKPNARPTPQAGAGVEQPMPAPAADAPATEQWPGQADTGQADAGIDYSAPISGPGVTEYGLKPGYKSEDDPTKRGVMKTYLTMLNAGKSAEELIDYLNRVGVNGGAAGSGKLEPNQIEGIKAQVAYHKAFPGNLFDDAAVSAVDDMYLPLSDTEKAVTGAADTTGGAFVAGAGNAILRGGEDELTRVFGGNMDRAQAAKQAIREEHPGAYFGGQVAGGIADAVAINKITGLTGKGLVLADSISGAIYGAGENNENRMGGAALGGALNAGGSALGSKIAGTMAARAPGQGALAVEQALKQDIDLPMGATGRAAAGFEKGLDILPPSAGTMQGARDRLGTQVDAAVDKVAGSYGTANSLDSMGDAAQAGAKSWIKKFDDTSDKLYAAIPIQADSPATFNNARSYLTEQMRKFGSNPALQDAMRQPSIKSYFDALSDPAAALSWADLKAFRSRIGEVIGKNQIGEKDSVTALRGLYANLTKDMKATAMARGPKALQAFERANTFHAKGKNRIESSLVDLLGKDSMKSAEAAGTRMQAIAKSGKATSDIKKLAEIRKSMPADEWGDVASSMIRLLGKPANSAGRDFDPGVFARNFKDMSPEAKNLLFTDRGRSGLRASLDEFNGVMENLAKNNALRNTSGTANASMSIGATTGAIAALMNPILAAKAAGGAAATYSLGKLWTNPRFVQWATGYTKMAANQARAAAGQPPNISLQMKLLQKVGASQPAIHADVQGLLNAFAQSPMRAAAEGEDVKDGGQIPPDNGEQDQPLDQ